MNKIILSLLLAFSFVVNALAQDISQLIKLA